MKAHYFQATAHSHPHGLAGLIEVRVTDNLSLHYFRLLPYTGTPKFIGIYQLSEGHYTVNLASPINLWSPPWLQGKKLAELMKYRELHLELLPLANTESELQEFQRFSWSSTDTSPFLPSFPSACVILNRLRATFEGRMQFIDPDQLNLGSKRQQLGSGAQSFNPPAQLAQNFLKFFPGSDPSYRYFLSTGKYTRYWHFSEQELLARLEQLVLTEHLDEMSEVTRELAIRRAR